MTKEEFAVLKDSKKYRYIVAAVVAVLALLLFVIGFFFCKIELEVYENHIVIGYKQLTFAQCLFELNNPAYDNIRGMGFALVFVLPILGTIVLSTIIRFAQIRTDYIFLVVFQIIVGFATVSLSSLLVFLCHIQVYAATWLVILGGIIGIFGVKVANYMVWLVKFIPNKLSGSLHKILSFFSQLTNFRYKGKAPISYFGKIIEVFVQILLLPISIFIELMFVPYSLIGLCFVGDLIIKNMFYLELKGEKDEKVEYESEVTKTVVKKTVEHDIKDNYGNKIGTYESLDDCVEYSGGGYVKDDQRKDAFKNGFFVLPLRIISLLLSVIALFVPKMYVKVTRPKVESEFKYKLFRYLDLIVFI